MVIDAIVIGGGLFGQIIAAALRRDGRQVQILDAEYEGCGSKPAACLMKPSWFSSMGKDVYGPALDLLSDLYEVQDIEFKTRVGNVGVYWIDPNTILRGLGARVEVTHIEGQNVHTKREVLTAPLIVVAAGIWTEKLLPQYPQKALMGVAWSWPWAKIQEPFIQLWAPYRQLVAFNRGDGLWASDGTAIVQKNWTTDREQKSYERCSQAVGLIKQKPTKMIGARPYAQVRPCLLEEVRPGLWVASGGAKNGTMAAGYCAHVISRSMQ